METRALGSTGLPVTPVGLGTWNMSRGWGRYSEEECREAVRTALDCGIGFIDTADVYRGGEAERHVGEVLADREESPTVATKAGKRTDVGGPGGYDYEALAGFVEDSHERLGVDGLELLQLHCPPTEVYYTPETFDALADLRAEGRIEHYGVSVELLEQAMKAIEYPGVETVQIIFNPFRQRPAERFFEAAACRNVGVIVRVPLASGLLADAFDRDTEFDEADHRAGEGAGSRGGETFAGVPFETGLEAVADLREVVPEGMTMAQFTLRWVLDHDAVSAVIPGSMTPAHIRENAAAADHDALSNRVHGAVRDVYEKHLFDQVHHRW